MHLIVLLLLFHYVSLNLLDNVKKIKEADSEINNSELDFVALKAAMRCIS